MIKYFLFDLDNTIYPPDCGVMQRLRDNILQFIVSELKISDEEAIELRKNYLKDYGTTLLGLRKHYNIDAEKYLKAVHNFTVEDILKPDKELDKLLTEISISKVIFTNSPNEHAENVLSSLQISHHFEKIFSIRWFKFQGKPDLEAYRKVTDDLMVTPEECILLEDSPANIAAAAQFGMSTVYVGEQNSVKANYRIKNIGELGKIAREIL